MLFRSALNGKDEEPVKVDNSEKKVKVDDSETKVKDDKPKTGIGVFVDGIINRK